MIGAVPDRGGRTDTMQAPPPEMPSWTQRKPDQGGGGRGGYQGGRGAGGHQGGGGGRGGKRGGAKGGKGGQKSSFISEIRRK